MVKEFNNLEEIQKYYDRNSHTYIFKENNEYIDLVIFKFDLNVEEHIRAKDIIALNITALNIDAEDIKALSINAVDIYAGDINSWSIEARDIIYYAVCFARQDIKCNSIKGRIENAKHFVLDGKLEVEEHE